MSAQWVVNLREPTVPTVTLLCVHHAGGQANSFRPWLAHLPSDLRVLAVELPGRGRRFGEPYADSVEQVVTAVCDELRHYDGPMIVFGHSMGARIGFEVARALAPSMAFLHVFASGARAPHLERRERFAQLPDTALWRRIAAWGGTPPEVLRDRDLMRIVTATLRADFLLLESSVASASPKLACPMSVLGGASDGAVTVTDLHTWADLADGPVDVRLFAGGHFYLEDCRAEVVAYVLARLQLELRGASGDRRQGVV